MLNALRRGSKIAIEQAGRSFASNAYPERKVALLGAAGGIGQPLGLLLKISPYVSQLSLYDIAGTPGVATDISHINSKAKTAVCNQPSDSHLQTQASPDDALLLSCAVVGL